jgi:hypothetical protein
LISLSTAASSFFEMFGLRTMIISLRIRQKRR